MLYNLFLSIYVLLKCLIINIICYVSLYQHFISDLLTISLWFPLAFHPVECSYCRSESMMGFRYRCQQCHGYQLCQSCFWRGHANGPHSNQHQMKEHSSWVGMATTKALSLLVFKIPPLLVSSRSSALIGKRLDSRAVTIPVSRNLIHDKNENMKQAKLFGALKTCCM